MNSLRFAKIFLGTALLGVFLTGCGHHHDANFHRGDFNSRHALKDRSSGDQLSELDVLGVSGSNTPTDEDIRRALRRASSVELRKGEPVLVIQSGRTVPDPRLIKELNQHYRAMPFSGVRSDWTRRSSTDPKDHYARALRFAAAQAGAEKIVCFWGELEIARHDLSTKTITWLPVIDVIVPDQKDNVRVHQKVAVIDVATADWSMFRTEPLQTDIISTGWGREHTEAPELRDLKEKSYSLAVNSLLAGKP